MQLIKHHVVLVAFGVCSSIQVAAVVLHGHVYTTTGQPVAGAAVDILPLDISVGTSLPGATTDIWGYHTMQIPPIGHVRVSAHRESEGFPDTRFAIFTSKEQKTLVVDLSADKPDVEANLRLPPPSCVVDGSVIDKFTKKPIMQARITIRKSLIPAAMISASVSPEGKFSYPLPAEPVEVEITALGYSRWTYKDANAGDTLIPNCKVKTAIVAELSPISK